MRDSNAMNWGNSQGAVGGHHPVLGGPGWRGIADRYSKLAENVELRKEWALRAGLGFSLDHLEKPGTHHGKAAKSTAKKPGTRKDPKADIVVKRSLVRRKPQSVIAEEVVPVED